MSKLHAQEQFPLQVFNSAGFFENICLLFQHDQNEGMGLQYDWHSKNRKTTI